MTALLRAEVVLAPCECRYRRRVRDGGHRCLYISGFLCSHRFVFPAGCPLDLVVGEVVE